MKFNARLTPVCQFVVKVISCQAISLRTIFTKVPFILLEILYWKEAKSRALFIFQAEFPEILL